MFAMAIWDPTTKFYFWLYSVIIILDKIFLTSSLNVLHVRDTDTFFKICLASVSNVSSMLLFVLAEVSRKEMP